MLEQFLDELFHALGRSLFFFIGNPENFEALRWSEIWPKALSSLLICLFLIGLFWLVYKLLVAITRPVGRKLHFGSSTKEALFKGYKYLWILASCVVVASQVGVSTKLIQGSVRGIFVGLFFYGLWIISNRLIESNLKKNALNQSVMQLIKNVSTVLILVLAISALMSQFGFDLVSIVAGLGIVGLAVGFAAQNTLADFIAGITILIEQPFKIGDWVRINEKEGMVERIALRTTRVRTRNNVSIVIPNSTVATAEVTNLTARHLVRFDILFGIAYEEKVEEAREVVLKAIEDTEHLLKTPAPSVSVKELADSGVNLILRYWLMGTNIDKQPKISESLLEIIHKSLVEADIEIPYPHVQLLTNKPPHE